MLSNFYTLICFEITCENLKRWDLNELRKLRKCESDVSRHASPTFHNFLSFTDAKSQTVSERKVFFDKTCHKKLTFRCNGNDATITIIVVKTGSKAD